LSPAVDCYVYVVAAVVVATVRFIVAADVVAIHVGLITLVK
jgi:hypothetical protein